MGGVKKRNAELGELGAQIERPKASRERGMGRGRPPPQPTRRSGSWERHKRGPAQSRLRTILVHIVIIIRRRTLVVEGNL